MCDMAFEGFYFQWTNFTTQHFFGYHNGTHILKFLIHLNFGIENISMERTNVTLQPKWYPNGTQKGFSKNINLTFPVPCQSSV
eukprot:UN24028